MLCELSLHHLQFGFQRKIFFFSLKNSSNHLQDLFSLAASNLWSWATSKMKMLFKHESESEVAQSCPTLCDPMDCSLPAFSIHQIFPARVLEWVTTSFSRRSSQPRK